MLKIVSGILRCCWTGDFDIIIIVGIAAGDGVHAISIEETVRIPRMVCSDGCTVVMRFLSQIRAVVQTDPLHGFLHLHLRNIRRILHLEE